MNQHQRYSCKRSLLNKCFNAFIQFHPESSVSKKEFMQKISDGGYINFIFPDFSKIEVLKNKSEVTFDGVEFKFADQEYREYTESQLDLLAAGKSSSGASISSKSRKRRITRTILYKCRNAYCQALNKEICIPDFIELLTNEHLEIPAEVTCNYDPEINVVQFDASNKKFKLRIQSIQENSLQLSNYEIIDPLPNNEPTSSDQYLVPLPDNEPTSSDQESVYNTIISIIEKEKKLKLFATTNNLDPELCFESKDAKIFFAEDINFEVSKVVGHYFGTDNKLYFELKWKRDNGRDFLESAESASLVHCDDLIKDYLKKIRKKLKLPKKRSCKGSLETADFDQFGSSEQERLLNKYKSLSVDKKAPKNKKRKT